MSKHCGNTAETLERLGATILEQRERGFPIEDVSARQCARALDYLACDYHEYAPKQLRAVVETYIDRLRLRLTRCRFDCPSRFLTDEELDAQHTTITEDE